MPVPLHRSFESVTIGDEIPGLPKPHLTPMHVMRWSAASENWHRIHYDEKFAVGHDRLPGLLVNGSLKQNFILQARKQRAGTSGWGWKVSFQFRRMDLVGTGLTVWGRGTGKQATAGGYGLVMLDIGIVNPDGQESTPGKAVVALPKEGGSVPYPFVPPAGMAA